MKTSNLYDKRPGQSRSVEDPLRAGDLEERELEFFNKDNKCWEVNKGLQTDRTQNTVLTLTIKSEPFCFLEQDPTVGSC